MKTPFKFLSLSLSLLLSLVLFNGCADSQREDEETLTPVTVPEAVLFAKSTSDTIPLADVRNANNPYDSLSEVGYESLKFFSGPEATARSESFSSDPDTLKTEVVAYIDSLVQSGTVSLPNWDGQQATDLMNIDYSKETPASLIDQITGVGATKQVKDLLKLYVDSVADLDSQGKYDESIALAIAFEDDVESSSVLNSSEKQVAFEYLTTDKWTRVAVINIMAPEFAKGRGFWRILRRASCFIAVAVAAAATAGTGGLYAIAGAVMFGGSLACLFATMNL